MTMTRRAMILKWAEEQSEQAIDRIPDRQKTRKNNLRKIHIVCRSLVARKKPRRPSAEEVAESGTTSVFNFDTFPSRQTLYNDYSEMLSFWRTAFDDIINLEAEPAASIDQLLAWSPSDLDAGSFENVKALKRLIREQKQANDALRRLVTDSIPVYMDRQSPEEASVADDLSYWMSTIEAEGFEMTEIGLVVTNRTFPGTLVMDRSLWDGLKRLIEIHQTSRRIRGALGDDDSDMEAG